jgi:DNA polymerase III sliding clamp (beta) subunit (PCNA family)
MSFVIVNRKALGEALKLIKPVAENAIGEFVKLSRIGVTLTLKSQSNDIGVSVDVDCGEGEDASCVIGHADFAKFVAAAKSDDVVMTFEDSSLRITCGKSSIDLMSTDPRAVPAVAVPPVDSISRDGLTDAIKFAAAGMSKEKVRYNMRGLWFQSHASGVNIWGASGPFMLRSLVPGLKLSANGTVPYDAIDVIKASGDDLAIDIHEREWVATVVRAAMWGPILGEAFPNVQDVVSRVQEIGQVASIKRGDLLDAIAVAAVGSSDGDKPMVTLEAKKSGLWVTGTERGNAVKSAGQHLIEMPLDVPLKIIIDTANLKKSVSAFPDGPINITHGRISNGDLIRLSTDCREAYLMGVIA